MVPMNRAANQEGRFDVDAYELPYENTTESILDLRKIALIIWRGRLLILLFIIFGLGVGAYHVSRQEPVYLAKTSILFEPERLQIVAISNVLAEPDAGRGLGNQIEILNSTTLLGKVVERLGLAEVESAELEAPAPDDDSAPADEFSLSRYTDDLLAQWGLPASAELIDGLVVRLGLRESPSETDSLSDEDRKSNAVRAAISKLRANLQISHIGGSRVIEVVYGAPDPQQAALVANTISDEYISFQQMTKNQDVVAVIEMVNRSIEDQRRRVARSEEALEAARLDLAARHAQSSEMLTIQLSASNQALADIRLRLADSQARYERAAAALEAGDDLWSVTEFRDSDLITGFRIHDIEIRDEIAQDRAISGDNISPSRARNIALRKQINASIREEAEYIVAALDFEVTSLKKREAQLEEMIRELEVMSIERTADELSTSRLEREVQANQTLLQTFVARQKEITEQANMQSADARILSRADPPSSPDREASTRLLLASGGAGLFLGALVLLLRERLDNSVRDPRELAEITRLPILASIPMVGKRRNLPKLAQEFLSQPKSLLAESIRNLRTGILYSDPARQPKVVMFTSSVPGESKSATSFLISLASQRTGRSTILVSCDLRDERNARIYSKFPSVSGSERRAGLAAYMRRECALEEALAIEPKSGLHVLALSEQESFHESPADILSSQRFKEVMGILRDKYDLVILDTPPALAVTDARLLASMADTIIYLVRWNGTSKNAVREGLRELQSMDAHLAGCVFTLVSQSKAKKYSDNEFIYKQSYAGYFS
ncbi:AAA family ATPase [Pikeienuella piscinae]|uniref:AAA family ATPase n=2 Tax=Pikeienuella piscinae TaxID=2748098 RepID=A0A7L5BYI0_9RHOB|nr:AAA family ATPase [Pikeienuella piscinae]